METKKLIADHLRYLEKVNGCLTPDMVVDDAMDPSSPLHGEFTWDQAEAARAYWLDQARKLIRSVYVQVNVDNKIIKTVNFVRDPTKSADEQGYLSVEKVKNDKETARDVLIDEFKRVGSALQRAQRLAMVFGIEDQIDAMSKQINKIRKDVEEHTVQ